MMREDPAVHTKTGNQKAEKNETEDKRDQGL